VRKLQQVIQGLQAARLGVLLFYINTVADKVFTDHILIKLNQSICLFQLPPLVQKNIDPVGVAVFLKSFHPRFTFVINHMHSLAAL
jgi:hypothetical protein